MPLDFTHIHTLRPTRYSISPQSPSPTIGDRPLSIRPDRCLRPYHTNPLSAEPAAADACLCLAPPKPFAMNYIKSTVNTLRDRYTPVSHTSTFRQTGQITPDEFLAAGDYLVYKFPTWSWGDADDESRRVGYLPPGKQYLVTRNVPCHRRLNDDFAGDAGHEEALVNDGDDFRGHDGSGADDDGWLRTGGLASSQPLKARDVRTVDDSGNMGEPTDEEDDIPDMEDDDDDEAIIRDVGSDSRNRCASPPHAPLIRPASR